MRGTRPEHPQTNVSLLGLALNCYGMRCLLCCAASMPQRTYNTLSTPRDVVESPELSLSSASSSSRNFPPRQGREALALHRQPCFRPQRSSVARTCTLCIKLAVEPIGMDHGGFVLERHSESLGARVLAAHVVRLCRLQVWSCRRWILSSWSDKACQR